MTDAVELARHLVEDLGYANDDVLLCLSCRADDARAERLGALPATREGIERGAAQLAARAVETVQPAVVLAFFGYGATTADGQQVVCPADTTGELEGAVTLRDAYARGSVFGAGALWWFGCAFDGPGGEGSRTLTPSDELSRLERPLPGQAFVVGPTREGADEDRRPIYQAPQRIRGNRRWPRPGCQIDPEHTGVRSYRAFDIRSPSGASIGWLRLTKGNPNTNTPAYDFWQWKPGTAPWPDLFYIAETSQPAGTGGEEAYVAQSFANAEVMTLATAPNPTVGKLWQLTAYKNGVSQAMDAHLWRWQPFGETPRQRWYARPPFTVNAYLPIDAQTTVWFTRWCRACPSRSRCRVRSRAPRTPTRRWSSIG